MKKQLFLLAAFIHLGVLSLHAVDFGLVFTQNAEIIAPDFDVDGALYDISGILAPRFTALAGETGDLHISAAVNYRIDPAAKISELTGDDVAVIPELTRTDVAFSAGYADIRIGRMFYSDPLGLVANNLFDGAQVSFITRNGNIRAGGWYTGFLYRERAAITMTDNELRSSSVKIDYNDFVNTYCAPSRVLAALEYDHPSLAGYIGLNVSLMAQNDLGSDRLNSQYVTAAVSVPGRSVMFDLGGCFELIEYNDAITPAFAADIGVTFMLPATLEKHIKLSGRYASGVSEDKTYGAFLPLTTVLQGDILEAKFSGLSLVSLDFTGRLAKSLSAYMAFTYFIRNDEETYHAYPADSGGSENFLLGGELFGRLIWNISTGLRLNLGTGVFLPSLGDVNPEGYMLWRSNINLVISIY